MKHSVLVEEPHIRSQAAAVLLKRKLNRDLLLEWLTIREAFLNKHEPLTCEYCGKQGLVREVVDPADIAYLDKLATVDHRIPKSKGGSDTEDNFAVVCFPCNNNKKDKDATIRL